MKQIVLAFCILLCSCEIQYDGETKLVVTGKILDENGSPIQNKNIGVLIYGGGTFMPSDKISYGFSDSMGYFTLIFPAPKGDYNIMTVINEDDNVFQDKHISSKIKNFNNYKLDLNAITLFRKESITSLRLILNNTTTKKGITSIEIEGKVPEFDVDLNLNPDNLGYFNTYYNVIKNQTVSLKYTVSDFSTSPSSMSYTISIPINSEAVTYTINY
ncbi:hypothetical protein [Flavobacterium faecale]|uniref:hypothetical protein n=1 Tax=Flavobacterium faecale TaxID=1355330 RepID=UPI003AAEF885